MNYFPVTFAKAIHDEKIERILTHQRRHNDSVMPRAAWMPDPIGLLFSQIHSAIDRGVARAIQAIFHAVPAANESFTEQLTRANHAADDTNPPVNAPPVLLAELLQPAAAYRNACRTTRRQQAADPLALAE